IDPASFTAIRTSAPLPMRIARKGPAPTGPGRAPVPAPGAAPPPLPAAPACAAPRDRAPAGGGPVPPRPAPRASRPRRAPSLAAALLAVAVAISGLHVTARGAILAGASGAVASGVGYSLWYAALRGLSATRAGVLQLLVPIGVALGGVVLLGEPLTARLLLVG